MSHTFEVKTAAIGECIACSTVNRGAPHQQIYKLEFDLIEYFLGSGQQQKQIQANHDYTQSMMMFDAQNDEDDTQYDGDLGMDDEIEEGAPIIRVSFRREPFNYISESRSPRNQRRPTRNQNSPTAGARASSGAGSPTSKARGSSANLRASMAARTDN